MTGGEHVPPPPRRRRISATALAQYVRFGNCDRLLSFILHPEKERELAARWRVRPQPLTPLLHAEGERYEREVVTGVAASGEVVVDLKHRGASATTEYLRRAGAGRRVVLAQAALDGDIGGWPCGGTADLIWLIPHPPSHAPGDPAGNDASGGGVPVTAVVADVKASLTARVEHRLQVAFYARLLRQMAAQAGVTLVSVSGVVLHREPDAPLPALSPDALEPFDLVPYDLALDHLLAGPEAVVPRVHGQQFETVPYSLDFKCDGCLFNGHCFHESQAQESLTLVPYLTAPEQRVLEQHGITTFRQLAALTQPASPQRYRGPLDPAPGQEGLLATLRAHWQLGGLDRHTQRARAMVRDRDQVRGDFEPVVDAGFGTLPAEETHPGLVKVFFDAQHDYVRDAVYLLGALVTGPGGEQIILERTAAPPERETEGAALARWVLRVYGAVLAVAQQPQAFVHLYTYSRHDQAVLLAALRRHVGRVPGIGALFDLLTDTAALAPISPLAQPMVSFLAEEVRERMSLALTCASLHAMASRMGFTWTGRTPAGKAVDFRRRFRARMFDGTRQVDLPPPPAGRQPGSPRPGETPAGAPARSEATVRRWIESAARFRSQIPLEYAYGAWRCLPEPADALQADLLQPFLDLTWDELEGFAAHRLRALAHIEGRFRQKNRFPRKHPLRLQDLSQAALAPASLPRALQDFLLIEHHTRLQELLLSYAQPIQRRAQTGRGMLVQCVSFEARHDGSARASCRLAFDVLGLDARLIEPALRLKEGDWVVLNPAADDPPPAAMLHGRLATIEAFTRDEAGHLLVELSLKSFSTRRRVFAYPHRTEETLEPGCYYTVDEMADDLNGDKLLAACRVAGDPSLAPNPLLAWLERAAATAAPAEPTRPTPPAAATPSVDVRRQLPFPLQTVAAHATQCLATIAAVEQASGGSTPTARQAEAIGSRLAEAAVLIQGPPGSGKSHTLGWAILVRLAAARLAGATSYRVAVSSKTHNAIGIVLASVAEKLALLRRHAPTSPFARAVRDLQLCKLQGESSPAGRDAPPPQPEGHDASPAGLAQPIRQVDPYRQRDELDRLLGAPWIVAGATPGGLYNAQRYRHLGGADVPWHDRPFDLVVVDEASQVTVPEAVLACAFLQEQGQVLIVGDHRQMPPIVATDWNEAGRRTVVDSEVYRSVFDLLLARGFPRVGLDQSFRLHRRLAAFLEEIIYRQDGIALFSTRDDALPAVQTGDPFVDAVLDPAYPVVVVEHGDAESQQFSRVELELMVPLLETCTETLHLDGVTGLGVVVPHRAQRALLRARFPQLTAANAIDTVERFQGGEREVIVVSATASDPDYILGQADFLLNPNRLNVALSRPRRKLIILGAGTLFRLLASDPDLFEQAALWKRLRYTFAVTPLWSGQRSGVHVAVLGHHHLHHPSAPTNGPSPQGMPLHPLRQATLQRPAPRRPAPARVPTRPQAGRARDERAYGGRGS